MPQPLARFLWLCRPQRRKAVALSVAIHRVKGGRGRRQQQNTQNALRSHKSRETLQATAGEERTTNEIADDNDFSAESLESKLSAVVNYRTGAAIETGSGGSAVKILRGSRIPSLLGRHPPNGSFDAYGNNNNNDGHVPLIANHKRRTG